MVLVKALLMANLEAERISVFLIISAKARPEEGGGGVGVGVGLGGVVLGGGKGKQQMVSH